jgi:hypothetical protein
MLAKQIYMEKSIIMRLFFLYFLTNIFLLLNFQGVYWDDWVVYSQRPDTVINIFTQTGVVLMGYLHVILQKIGNGIYIYRILSFFGYFASGVFLYFILQKSRAFDKASGFFIALLFLLAPVNYAKMALVNATPIIFLSIFYLSFFLLSLYLENKKNIFLRVVILSLFLISFTVESVLVFYVTILFYIFYTLYNKNPEEKVLTLFKIFITHYLDFILLPLVFFGFKHFFLQPNGLYVGYNAIRLDIYFLYILIKQSFETSLYEPIFYAFSTAYAHLTLTVFIFILVCFTLKNFISADFPKGKSIGWFSMLIMGIMLFIFAMIPYCAVGKLPQMGSWESRHQLLVSFSIALIVFSLVSCIRFFNKKLSAYLLYGIISIFIVRGLHTYYLYDMDWFYQVSLMEQFKHSKIMREHSTFIVKDHLESDVWINSRSFNPYELNGLMKYAFKEDTRLIVQYIDSIESYQKFSEHPQYNFAHWTYEQPIHIEFFKNENVQLTRNAKFKLFFYSIFNPEEFKRKVKNLTKITFHKLEVTNN